jgi:hypothetical protein
MPLHLFNTYSRAIEEFHPLDPRGAGSRCTPAVRPFTAMPTSEIFALTFSRPASAASRRRGFRGRGGS